jgi:hypothetical protein
MIIIGIDLKNLRNDEYFQIMKNTTSLVETNGAVVLNVVAQNDALIQKTIEYDVLFKRSTASEITQEIFDIDVRRDNAVIGISNVVNGNLYHFDPTMKAAATKLDNNLKLYGAKIISQNYQAETATLSSLVGDWETKPDLTAAMTLLNLKVWKDELKAANILFDEKYLARTHFIKKRRNQSGILHFEKFLRIV